MSGLRWRLQLVKPGFRVNTLLEWEHGPLNNECEHTIRTDDGEQVSVRMEALETYMAIEASVLPEAGYPENQGGACYLSLEALYGEGEPYTFNGPVEESVTIRQSPHEISDRHADCPKQAVPVIAIRQGSRFAAAVSDHPAAYGNATTQSFDLGRRSAVLSTGDPGSSDGSFVPRFHSLTGNRDEDGDGRHHPRLSAIILESDADNLQGFRMDLFRQIGRRWGQTDSDFHALAFAPNYMHLRFNETGYSREWIVPGIEYWNKQYPRDAFWQTMVLPLDMEQQCYDAVYEERYKYSENALLYLIWSDRLQKRGGRMNPERVRDAAGYVEARTRDGAFHAELKPSNPCLKSWFDTCAFEEEDVIAYNQGLLVAALLALRELGMPGNISYHDALEVYRGLFIAEGGFYPLSRMKRGIAVDPMVGDLLAQLYYQTPLLERDRVHSHYRTLLARSATAYGFKVVCGEHGEYLPPVFYQGNGHLHEYYRDTSPGSYQWGGSWYLYDMLCLMSCCLNEAEGAEQEMIRRTRLEIRLGGTYHEYVDTSTGIPHKANQGWNAAVYAIWSQLVREGRVSDRFLREIKEEFDRMNGRT